MAFNPTTQIFNTIDDVATNFVADNLSQIIAIVTPWVALGLTIALMAEGVSIMASPSGDPLSGLVKRFIRYVVIISIAGAGGLYQTQLADTALKLPDQVASALVINGNSVNQSGNTSNVIDKTLNKGMKAANNAFDGGSIWSGHGWMMYGLGAAILLVTVLMCALGAGLILMAKFMLAITVCFGPIFIFALLFRGTEELFGKWMGSLVNYMLLTVLLSAVFGMMLSFFEKTVSVAANPSAGDQLLPLTIGAGLISVVSWLVMKAIPGVAASWGAGITAAASGFGRGSIGSRVGKGVDKAGGAAGGAAKSGAGKAAGAAGSAASSAASAAGGAMKGMARGSRH